MVSADQQPVVVAAFDVDGTLTSRDCVVPFLVRIGGWSRVLRASVRHPVLLASTALGRGDRDRLKEVVVGQLVRGRNRASLDELGRRFALDAVAGWLRADTLARLRWHRESGHRVVLVSASLRHYLHGAARRGELSRGREVEAVVGVDRQPQRHDLRLR